MATRGHAVDPSKIAQLLAMGFDKEKATVALVRCSQNVEVATDLLLSGALEEGSNVAAPAPGVPPGRRLSVVRPDQEGSVYIQPLDPGAFVSMDVKQADPKTLPACVVQPRRLNRYLDILPNPGTRVVLAKPDASDPRWRELASLCDDFPGMSAEQRELVMRYYNANYVRGYAFGDDAASSRSREYIAAEGPTPATTNNFVKMLWDERCACCVMCTRIVEGGRDKCNRYWPDRVGDTLECAGILVQNITSVNRGKYDVTELMLKHVASGQTHKVCHYWFKGWPDHGVPTTQTGEFETGSLIEMLKAVRKKRALADKRKSPLAIHCSAGVGRTGTLIVIDYMITAIRFKDPIDVLETINMIRNDRMCLVQHAEQYRFAYEAGRALVAEADGRVLANSPRVQAGGGAASSGFESGLRAALPAAPVGDVTLQDYPWYKPTFNQDQACVYLFDRSVGDFVVRDSSRYPGCYALNVKEMRGSGASAQVHVANMLIIQRQSQIGVGYVLGENATRIFHSVFDLISYYIVKPYTVDEATAEERLLKFPD